MRLLIRDKKKEKQMKGKTDPKNMLMHPDGSKFTKLDLQKL